MELKSELTIWDKLKSWKRWMAVAAALVPLLVQAFTGAVGWPVTIVAMVVALAVGIMGLAKEDAARLTAVGMVIANAVTKDDGEEDEEEEYEELDEDEEYYEDEDEWEEE